MGRSVRYDAMSGPSVFVGRFIPNLKVVPCSLKFELWKMAADYHHDIMTMNMMRMTMRIIRMMMTMHM